MDGSITLWQFLRALLDQKKEDLICWTSNEGEFKLLQAEEVAKLWGLKKNKSNMNYDKLSRALRYYYEKNIIKKVSGQKFVYKFVSAPDSINQEPVPCDGPKLSEEGASCEAKSFQPSTRMSSRNEYMRSGLYTSFTLQSLRDSSILWPTQKKEIANRLPEPKGYVSSGKESENFRTNCRVSPQADDYPKEQGGDTREKEKTRRRGHRQEWECRDTGCKEERERVGGLGLWKETECVGELGHREEGASRKERKYAAELGHREERAYPGESGTNAAEESKVAHPIQQNTRASHHPKAKKPKDLALKAPCVSAEVAAPHAPEADEMLDPKVSTAPFTMITQHIQTPLILTPGAFPSAIHFWSTLSPIAPGSPAKVSFQFPSSVNAQIHIPVTNLDGLSTPVLSSPGLQKL
ncbi:ETS domain-containing protein Elk-3-like [Rhinatrema bivittatum]|uniref:ETS domain-containing protein Elk-3-like n=1 Tax=Rhinatrema bivittatum TaxID=194408 RepID=UPI001128BA4C|nr:ETS domain-containing protein Elk-3-like [Rhinatrema bivittatum]